MARLAVVESRFEGLDDAVPGVRKMLVRIARAESIQFLPVENAVLDEHDDRGLHGGREARQASARAAQTTGDGARRWVIELVRPGRPDRGRVHEEGDRRHQDERNTKDPCVLHHVSPPSVDCSDETQPSRRDGLDLARPPLLREERLERAVEAHERVPALAGNGPDPSLTAVAAFERGSLRNAGRSLQVQERRVIVTVSLSSRQWDLGLTGVFDGDSPAAGASVFPKGIAASGDS